MRLEYETRHGLFGDILRDRFSSGLEVIPSAAGLHISAVAPDASVDRIGVVVRRAAQVGVAVHPLALFALERPAPAGLIFGYGAIPTGRIEAGLGLLER